MPLFDSANTTQLKSWLATQLDGICDADPEVLSDYVMALLKHDSTADADLQNLLKEQLEDFLSEHTNAFVASVLKALHSQSYLPQASHKRRAEEPPEQAAAPSKAPRSSANVNAATQQVSFVHQPPEARHQRGNNGRAKELCRDYHQKGFCARGIDCRYEHSSDMLVGASPPAAGIQPRGSPNAFASAFPSNGGMAFVPGMLPNGAASQSLPPMRMGRPSFQAAGPPASFGQASPWQGHAPHQQGAEASSHLAARMSGQIQGAYVPHGGFAGGNVPPARPNDGAGGLPRTTLPQQQQQQHTRGTPGSFTRHARSATALVLENVPVESLELITINDYFKRFGTITNIQLDKAGNKALVDFASPEEAKAAHACPDAVFGNRFVKIWYQRIEDAEAGQISTPLPPPSMSAHLHAHGVAQAERSKPANLANGQNVYTAPGAPVSAASTNAQRHKAQQAQRASQDALDLLITEQKRLMLAISGAGATPEGRKAAMARLRALEGEIQKATETVKAAVQVLATLPKVEAGTPSITPEEVVRLRALKEKCEKEQLDRELDMHGKREDTTTEELKAKLESLKAEAASLGLDANGASASRGAYRGRGRGAPRGTYFARGGRGGTVGGRMTLDNRTTKLVVSDVPASEKEKVKEHFKSFGETFEISDSASGFTIVYKARASGEAALRTGGEVPGLSANVKIQWAAHASGTATAEAAPRATAAVSEASTPHAAAAEGEANDEEEDDWNP